LKFSASEPFSEGWLPKELANMFVNLLGLCYISAGGITKQNNQRVKMAGK